MLELGEHILTIDSIVAGGDGLARQANGMVVFVPRTAPGDRVEVEVVEERRGWARARAVRIVEPSSERCDPPCPHYAVCGGCQLQHLEYQAQLRVKSGIIADSLRRLGTIAIEPPHVVPSSREFGYRNRVRFVLRRTADGVVAGLHSLEAAAELVDVDRCPLAEEELNRAWGELRAVWGVNTCNLPRGNELRLTLRATSSGQLGLAIEGGEDCGDPETLLDRIEGLSSIWGIEADGAIDWYCGEARLRDRWGAHEVMLAGLSFVQVNREVSEKLEVHVRQCCGELKGQRVIDAYCGSGLRALELAWAGARVVGIDADSIAIEAAAEAATESGAPVRFVAAPVERALSHELPADLVVLNPPRRGLDRRVVEALLERPPSRLIYVSCDPATLARDLERLGGEFELDECRAFDMFAQTAHVETVVTLVR